MVTLATESMFVGYAPGIPFPAIIAIAVVALLHVWFLVLEMFVWTTPLGAKLLKRPLEELRATAVLAKNQGLYNGFLAAGLAAATFCPRLHSPDYALFFLGCVIVAGVYGAATASPRIFWLQAFPAIVALALLLFPRLL